MLFPLGVFIQNNFTHRQIAMIRGENNDSVVALIAWNCLDHLANHLIHLGNHCIVVMANVNDFVLAPLATAILRHNIVLIDRMLARKLFPLR